MRMPLNLTDDLRTNEYVNSLPVNGNSGRIAFSDAACDPMLMEDGPIPMKNMKPVEKNPTGADQFRLDHQTESGGYGKRTDRQNIVDTHNRACPKLIDELEKKRSTALPKALSAKRNYATKTAATYDPKCKICVKLRKEQIKREKKGKRITEKRRSRKVRHSPYRRQTQRKVRSLTLRKLTHAAAASQKSHLSLNASVDSKTSKVLSKRAITDASSVESYYTFYSADHEPMVE